MASSGPISSKYPGRMPQSVKCGAQWIFWNQRAPILPYNTRVLIGFDVYL